MKTAFLFALGLTNFVLALEVHEWGTFTVLSGSDGAHVAWYAPTSDLAHLPDFVSGTSFVKITLSSVRMETPVIYFYPEKEMAVSVEVAFNGGNVTETFPHGSGSGGVGSEVHKTIWTGTLCSPEDQAALDEIPVIRKSNDAEPYGAAREVPEAWIFESDLTEIPGREVQPHFPQVEKFIFYRGAGNGHIPMKTTMADDEVTITNTAEEAIPFAVALRVRDGKAAWLAIPAIPGSSANDQPAMNRVQLIFPQAERPLDEVESELATEWRKALTADGLTMAEASAMVETWRKTRFRESCDRILTLVPRKVTEAMLPLKITPAPAKIERVFVARIEMISSEREDTLVALLNSSASPDEKDFSTLKNLELGRFGNGALEIASRIQRDRMFGKYHALRQFGEVRKNSAK